MTPDFKIAVVGEVFVDHIFTDFDHFPLPGEEVFAERYRREAGGGTVNTACALARLGHSVSLFGVLGRDEEVWLRSRLETFGVDASHALSSGLPNGLTASMSTTSDRSFLSYAGANQLIDEYVVSPETVSALSEADHVHFAMPLFPALAERLLPALRSANCTLSLDPGWREEWLSSPRTVEVLRIFDLFLPNEREAQLLTNSSSPEMMLRAFVDVALPNTVVKLGARGAAALHNGRVHTCAPPPIKVVDTTGAGDAFDAGFLDAWLAKCDIDQQLLRGCICGAMSTRDSGALAALPSRRDLTEAEAGMSVESVR